ncbi:DNA adenine methylase [Candidatus Poribacteria bacterium]
MRFLRYPGGKTKLLSFLCEFLPRNSEITGNYVEPFVGGGSVFLSIKPRSSILSDLNSELIELYRGVRNFPHKVWEIFSSFPEGKKAYYQIRDSQYDSEHSYYRAARTLYLNRTCFKGMWRHSPNGSFNVGYGGEERRWVITHQNIVELSRLLRKAELKISDFERTLDEVSDNDFVFLDPPYKPGEKVLKESHYAYGEFTFNDQIRLSKKMIEISGDKNVKWVMTNTSHKEICHLYRDFNIVKVPKGTGNRIGIHTDNSKEIVICNF